MIRTVLLLTIAVLLPVLGCASPAPDGSTRIGYLPDGTMVLLQSSGEDQPVTFPDLSLELVIREKLEEQATILPGESISTKDLEEIVYLDASNRGIVDLKGLEYCINLGALYLHENNVTDLSPISALPGALIAAVDKNGEVIYTRTYLTIWLERNNLSDISPLSGLSKSDELTLSLSHNEISDITALANLHNLIHLYLWENNVSDLSPLATLTNLSGLELPSNQIEDVSPLAELKSLAWIELYGNMISDVSCLSGLINLDLLGLGSNRIEDVSPLANLTNLRHLELSSNNIEDISPLATLTNLCWAQLAANRISDISPLLQNEWPCDWPNVDLRWNPLSSDSINIYIPELQARGVVVDY